MRDAFFAPEPAKTAAEQRKEAARIGGGAQKNRRSFALRRNATCYFLLRQTANPTAIAPKIAAHSAGSGIAVAK